MVRQVQTFSSFEAADLADARYYAALTPQQRLDIVLELADRFWGNSENSGRLARVYRVDELIRG